MAVMLVTSSACHTRDPPPTTTQAQHSAAGLHLHSRRWQLPRTMALHVSPVEVKQSHGDDGSSRVLSDGDGRWHLVGHHSGRQCLPLVRSMLQWHPGRAKARQGDKDELGVANWGGEATPAKIRDGVPPGRDTSSLAVCACCCSRSRTPKFG